MKLHSILFWVVMMTVSAAQADEHRRGPHHGPPLTDAQRTCVEGIVGKPGSGTRPTHEQMDAAFTTCGVAKRPPKGEPPQDPPTDSSSSGSASAQ